MRRRFLPSLRSLLALTFGAVALVAATSAAIFSGSEAARRFVVRDAAGREALAQQLAGILAQGAATRVELSRGALAWPAHRSDAAPNGMVSAHFSLDWARATVDRFGAAVDETKIEMLVLARDGRVLLGPPDLEGTIVADPAGPGPWPDGRRYLVGMADAADPGWRVVARQPAEIALAPVRELKRRVAADATVAALLAAALGWLMARAIARPGEALADAARQAGGGAALFRSDLGGAWYREARDVTVALRGLMAGLRRTATRRAEAEAALRDLNQTLEQRVADRTAALEAANLQLAAAQRLETIGKLTGGVAHDINNLLQVLESGLVLLNGTADDARRRDVQATMAKAVGRGSRLTRQLLAFARQQPLAPLPVALGPHLQEQRDLLMQSLRDDITLEIVVPAETWPVMVDRAQFDVALLNLAVNARDAMPNGGTLRIVAANATLAGPTAREELAGHFVQIEVADTGAGMPAEVLARAFEPFFTTKDSSRGSGLGLSQVWGFARQSGGTARIDSEPGAGTSVLLVLPRAVATMLQGGSIPVPPALEGNGRMLSVLLVEDDPDVSDLLTEVLESFGHTVRHVPTGVAALEALGNGYMPDVVLTDIMMPGGVSGLALVQELRRRAPGLPVVLATGYSDKAAEVQKAGLPVLRKPFRASELAATLEQVTRGRQTGSRRTEG
jgi:signal transduction histidine kinase/CheY-like chemotaxis protein